MSVKDDTHQLAYFLVENISNRVTSLEIENLSLQLEIEHLKVKLERANQLADSFADQLRGVKWKS